LECICGLIRRQVCNRRPLCCALIEFMGRFQLARGLVGSAAPAAGNRKFDFLITRDDIPSAERSDRVLLMNKPSDGDKMVAWEYGAFRVEPGASYQVDGTLTPHQIYHSTSWE
jgi:hypothetical protein